MINLIYNDFVKYMHSYGGNAVICGILGMLLSGFIDRKTQNRKNAMWRKKIVFFFSAYLYMMYALTILSRSESYISQINLIPFATFSSSEWDRIFFYENILLFFPFPIFLYLLYPVFRKFGICLFMGMLVSTLIELSQFLFHCGWCDIDDILTNTLGTVLGWLCIHRIYQIKNRRRNNDESFCVL